MKETCGPLSQAERTSAADTSAAGTPGGCLVIAPWRDLLLSRSSLHVLLANSPCSRCTVLLFACTNSVVILKLMEFILAPYMSSGRRAIGGRVTDWRADACARLVLKALTEHLDSSTA